MQAAIDTTQHTLKRVFFLLGVGLCEDGILYSCILMLFSMMFSKFLMCFPRGVRNSISPYRISFAQSSPFLSYIGETKGDTPSSHKTCYFGEPPKFQFFWVMGNLKWPLVKGKFRKRTLEAAHLIPVMSNQNLFRGGFWNPLCGHGPFQRQFQK
jgi:hypothetical protein